MESAWVPTLHNLAQATLPLWVPVFLSKNGMYGSAESLDCTPATNTALQVNYTGIKIKCIPPNSVDKNHKNPKSSSK